MPEKTTPRLKLPYPTAIGKVKTGATNLQELAERIDAILYPTGMLFFTAVPTVAEGWLACEGQAVSRTTYKALFEAIGTAYGEGDKSTTFNIPDCRGRVPVGVGTGSGLTARIRGEKLGEEKHKLTIGELASHSHTGKTGTGVTSTESATHNHNVNNTVDYFLAPTFGPGEQGVGQATIATGANNQSHTHNVPALTIPAEGGGEGHQNMQPSIVCGVWIKT